MEGVIEPIKWLLLALLHCEDLPERDIIDRTCASRGEAARRRDDSKAYV